MKHLIAERKKGQELAPFFNQKGWERDIYNNTFKKEDKEAYFCNGYLIFCFAGVQRKGLHTSTYHRIKLK